MAQGHGNHRRRRIAQREELALAHVGDSRVYLYRAGELSRLTDDHSWVHEQVSAGILTEEEAKTHPLKNVVTRALGGGPSVAPDLREMEFSRGTRSCSAPTA